MPRVKYMDKTCAKLWRLEDYPNFSVTGSIEGMKKLYYGKDALLVRSGSYIYHVPKKIYDRAW